MILINYLMDNPITGILLFCVGFSVLAGLFFMLVNSVQTQNEKNQIDKGDK